MKNFFRLFSFILLLIPLFSGGFVFSQLPGIPAITLDPVEPEVPPINSSTQNQNGGIEEPPIQKPLKIGVETKPISPEEAKRAAESKAAPLPDGTSNTPPATPTGEKPPLEPSASTESIPASSSAGTTAETAPAATSSELKPDTTTTTTTIPPTTVRQLTDAESEMLHRNLLELSKLDTPEKLFQFIRERTAAHNYQAAALAMGFGHTKYSTTQLQEECLTNWRYIIDRLEEYHRPTKFPEKSTLAQRRFQTASGKIINLDFIKDANNCWQIGPESINLTDEIYVAVQNERTLSGDWLSRVLPDWMYQFVFGLAYYQWFALGIGFFGGIIVYYLLWYTLCILTRAYFRVVYKDVTRQTNLVWKQVSAIVLAIIWFQTVSFAVPSPRVYNISYYAVTIFITIMNITILLKLIDVFVAWLKVKMGDRFSEENMENLVIPLISRSMKAVAICLGVISVMHVFQLPVVGIISGLGIGGVAIAFAAKETLGNFFGSLTVLIDKPFEIGDWVLVDGIEGTVVAVGMRSTRISTLDDSVITIPNNNLTTAVINNFGRRRNRRFKTSLGVQYDTSVERIDAFCEGIRELIQKNAFTKKDGFNISLYNLGGSAIELLLSVVIVCPSPETENRERAKLLRNIMILAESLDIRFAYPTQTLFIANDEQKPYTPLPNPDPLQAGRDSANKILYPEEAGAKDGG